MAREFVKMVLSKHGQGVVLRDGYVPLPASVTSKTLKELGIDFTVVKENGRSWNYFSCAETPSIRILADGYLIWEKGSYTGDAIAVPLLEGMVLAAQDNQPSKSRLN